MMGGGAILGVIGSLILLRAMSSLLFGVQPQDAVTYAIVIGLLTIVAIAASYLPARKASRIAPVTALRQD
jgi:ABC-type antimicrobial peptide transport system permease subunit